MFLSTLSSSSSSSFNFDPTCNGLLLSEEKEGLLLGFVSFFFLPFSFSTQIFSLQSRTVV
jgi:hypothetical protein